MRKVILYRRGCNARDEDDAEVDAAIKAGFTVVENRTLIQKDDFVIPRYSVYPFAKEFFEDITYTGASTINTFQQFNYIADLKEWYQDLQGLTPETWDDITAIPDEGPFILKGETNSRKSHWKSMMFAENKKKAIDVHYKLSNDGLIGQQHIYIRKYEELISYGNQVNGMPIAKEFRFFICNGKIMDSSFYWSNAWNSDDPTPIPDGVDLTFIESVIDRVGGKSNFYVIDVAQKINMEWIVIELNEGTCSGISGGDVDVLYKNLFEATSLNK